MAAIDCGRSDLLRDAVRLPSNEATTMNAGAGEMLFRGHRQRREKGRSGRSWDRCGARKLRYFFYPKVPMRWSYMVGQRMAVSAFVGHADDLLQPMRADFCASKNRGEHDPLCVDGGDQLAAIEQASRWTSNSGTK